MNKICEDLKTLYNTNVLDSSTPIQQAVFLNEAEKHKNENEGNTTLMKLIYNHFRAEKPNADKISGPKTLSVHWSDKYQKLIYVFGEFHGRKESCRYVRCKRGQVFNPESNICIPEKSTQARELISRGVNLKSHTNYLPIDQYFDKLFLNTDVFIDYFVEVPTYGKVEGEWAKKKYYADSYIADVMEQSANCVQAAKRSEEKCALIRAHYIDIRRNTLESFGVRNFLDTFYYAQEMNIKKMKRKLKEPQFASIIDAMTRSEDEIFEYFMQEYRNSPYNSKELQRSYIKEDIDKFAEKIIRESVNQEYILLNELAQKIQREPTGLVVEQFVNELTSPNARMVDPYTLARIFKRFDVEKSHILERKREQPVEPRNIIIYAGNAHSENYRDFFDEIGFIKLEETQEYNYADDIRCLNMENIHQPLFSQNPLNL